MPGKTHTKHIFKFMLTDVNIVKDMLQKHSLSPRKSLGQNFLVNKDILQKIITTSELSKNDIIIEVGPGIGTLTKEMAGSVKKVIAIEKDKNLIPILKENLISSKNINIINEDILDFNHKEKNYKVIANIPYYITSPIIRKFLEEKNPPSLMVLMIQKEVADRIIAKPPKANLLAVSVQAYAEPKIVKAVSKSCFWPQPDVVSSLIKITPHKSRLSPSFYSHFFNITKIGFSHPRKQLQKNIQLHYKKNNTNNIVKSLECANINLKRRAETLTIEEWKKITKIIMEKNLHL